VPEDTTKKVGSFKVYVGGVPDYGYDGEGLKIADITPLTCRQSGIESRGYRHKIF